MLDYRHATLVESKRKIESSERVNPRENVIGLLVMIRVVPIGGLVVRWSHRVLRGRQHDFVTGRHSLLMVVVVMMMSAGHHLMMRLLVVLVVHARVTGIVHGALFYLFTSLVNTATVAQRFHVVHGAEPSVVRVGGVRGVHG